MSHFWTFARGMLRHRLLMTGTVVMATLSGTTLVGGLLGAGPVLDSLIGEHRKDLPQLARDLNASLAQKVSFVSWLQIPDDVIARLPTGADTALYWIMGGLIVLTVLGSLANFLHAFLSQTVVNLTITSIRHRMFHAVVRAPLSRVVGPGSSSTDMVSRLVNDTTQLAGGFNQLLSRAMLQVFKGIAALAAALAFNWLVTVVAMFAVAPLFVVIRKLGKKIRRASGRALSSQAELFGVTTQALQGLKVVKVNTAERLEGGRFHRINKRVMHELNRVRTARAISSPLTEMLSIFLLCGLVMVAANARAKGTVDLSGFVLALASLAVAGASLKPLTGIISDIQASEAAANRIAEVLHAEHEPGHGPKLPKLPRHARSIELRNVTFAYPGSPTPALRELSLTIPHGRRVAIVGPNGCGKSTLLSLLSRLHDPQQGAVLVDDRDIRECSVRSLRSQIGVVTQEPILFADSVRNNIAYGAENVTDERVLEAARRARAHDFIERLPKGYDTIVAEQGMSLSGGQRQRICIARAILRDPAILILDEATSMIDAESEARIAEALSEFMRGRTSVVVAHRLSTVIDADAIVVMDKGRIVDQGTHEQLLARCDLYQRLVRTQLGAEPVVR